jgi:hypothetical protein
MRLRWRTDLHGFRWRGLWVSFGGRVLWGLRGCVVGWIVDGCVCVRCAWVCVLGDAGVRGGWGGGAVYRKNSHRM